jgi:Ala-tRNA(Pro) deacylase
MSVNPRLKELLDRRGTRHEVVPHRETITAHQAAQTTHVSGQHVAKAVVMRDAMGSDFMLVVPSSFHVDDKVVHHVTGRAGVRLEDEAALTRLFPDCELGAMPPFGALYGLSMFVDPCLLEDEDGDEIWFQAGNHHELVRMSVADYARIAQPFHASACLHREPVGSVGG